MSGAGEAAVEQTDVGSYFVANYPPFSAWTPEAVASDGPAGASTRARRRPTYPSVCISTSRSAGSAAISVTSGSTPTRTRARSSSISICWRASGTSTPRRRRSAGRNFNFVYFGGGTPSFLSTKQLQGLVGRLNATGAWNDAEEITFECEPGTITEAKLAAIRELGVTRLSLGVENFDDRILELNGRAHRSPEIGRSYEAARALNFPQINIDLIAGMLGETEANWRDCIERTLALEPDSVTIYQMELPYNTTISGDLLNGGGQFAEVGRRLGDQAPLGAGSVRRARARRLSHRQRVYRGQESVEDEVRVSRSAVGRRRPARPRRRVVRPHQRRPRAEPRQVADVSGGDRERRDSARPRLSSDRRRTIDSRVRAAAEARLESARRTSRRSTASTCCRALPARSTRCARTAISPRRAPIASR